MDISEILQSIVSLLVSGFGGWLAWLAITNRGDITRPSEYVGGICAACGYPVEGRTDLRCPECGDAQRHRGTIYPISKRQRFWRAVRRIGMWCFGVQLVIGGILTLPAFKDVGVSMWVLLLLIASWVLGSTWIIRREQIEAQITAHAKRLCHIGTGVA